MNGNWVQTAVVAIVMAASGAIGERLCVSLRRVVSFVRVVVVGIGQGLRKN
jgi:hypothetical protein